MILMTLKTNLISSKNQLQMARPIKKACKCGGNCSCGGSCGCGGGGNN